MSKDVAGSVWQAPLGRVQWAPRAAEALAAPYVSTGGLTGLERRCYVLRLITLAVLALLVTMACTPSPDETPTPTATAPVAIPTQTAAVSSTPSATVTPTASPTATIEPTAAPTTAAPTPTLQPWRQFVGDGETPTVVDAALGGTFAVTIPAGMPVLVSPTTVLLHFTLRFDPAVTLVAIQNTQTNSYLVIALERVASPPGGPRYIEGDGLPDGSHELLRVVYDEADHARFDAILRSLGRLTEGLTIGY